MYQIDIWLELNFLFKTINGLLIRLILTDFAITNEIGGEFGWNFRFGFPQNSSFHTCASLWIFWCNPRCKSSVGSSHDRSFKLIVTWVASLFSKVVEYWVDQSTFGSFRFQIHKIPHFFYFQLPKPLNPRVTSKHPIITQIRLKHQSCNLQQKPTPLSGFIWFILIHHYEIYKKRIGQIIILLTQNRNSTDVQNVVSKARHCWYWGFVSCSIIFTLEFI